MSKRLEKLADDMINLTPEESQKLALIVRAKLMPEIAKQQQQGLLQQANNPMMQQMGKRRNMQMPMPNAAQAAQQGLLQRQEKHYANGWKEKLLVEKQIQQVEE